jgi:uncharacterized OsmC-like protein
MRHDIHIGRNSLASDLSVEEGGEGSGPNPHDLYDAAQKCPIHKLMTEVTTEISTTLAS